MGNTQKKSLQFGKELFQKFYCKKIKRIKGSKFASVIAYFPSELRKSSLAIILKSDVRAYNLQKVFYNHKKLIGTTIFFNLG